jgi:hypothetical protein
MKRLLSGLALILISVSALASKRTRPETPLATIPGQSGFAAIAAQNGILALAYNNPTPQVQLYAIPTWTQPVATLTPSTSSLSINSVAIQNDYVAVGVENSGVGAIYIFTKPEGGWASESQSAILTVSGLPAGDVIGRQVSVWGNTLLASSNGNAGYIFVEPQGGWVNTETETAYLYTTGNFGFNNVSLTGSVGSGGSLAVAAYDGDAYVFVEPEGGWVTMSQTVILAGGGGEVAAAKSTIVISSSEAQVNGLYIYNEPEGGWVNSSTPSFVAAFPRSKYIVSNDVLGLTQSAQVLVGGISESVRSEHEVDETFLWHADNDFAKPITLSASGLTTTLQGATVTAGYAFSWDSFGNVFVFNGN